MHLFLRIILFIGLLFFPLLHKGQNSPPTSARFIWTNQHESDRFQVTAFRYDLEIEENVSEAMIHLFADSRYHLIVNGQFINFGPARFYPAHPMYDSYNIAPYLRKGNNAIAVKVFSNGTSSFQLRRNPGGFIAWGNVKTTGDQQFSLETPGNWRCMPLNGYHGNTPRMSFATGPMEVYDSRKDDQDWCLPEHSFKGKSPVEVENQEIWGELTPRNIPHLTREVYKPQELVGAYQLKNDEEMLSFRVAVPDKSQSEFRHNRPLLGYTYIYSPKDQNVEAGIWWGNHYLNGEGPLPQEDAGPDKPHRQTIHLQLKKGWNAFFVQRNSFWGKWDFFMAYPKTAGLILSPDKKKNDANWFRVAGPFLENEEETVNSLKFPLSPKDLPANLSAGWRDLPVGSFAHNPAVEMSWQYLGEKMELPSIQIENITLDQPSALVFDFRYKKLARIVVEYEAPEG
ncbi:MAG: alpha-L-rhamnosidase N-terminal domain-containing protein, partial [Bacteroidetes bacterium]|nr:alpha-L-rhamnosidase N-terminal domain-containing protein [Bacteroidota bacterium]